ncbi:MmcQ/YjbR family DNA-binding protein [Sharpea azabuensis]|uniref:MmcQ/YjbR family DNA-binding protein n=1 Tax=Sharpea azabuensis TaxID=322505 RepID=UPI003CFDAC0D
MAQEDIFNRKKANIKKLIAYGFIKKGDSYFYKRYFFDDAFYCIVEVSDHVACHVYDASFNEEYALIHSSLSKGTYISQVRESYQALLEDIVTHCFDDQLFVYNQTMRIAKWIEDNYHLKPEFPWKTNQHAIYRHQDNKKWITIIMYIERSKISKGEGMCEVMNVKAPPADVDRLILEEGIYECYHMNKKNWVSIILDDTLEDSRIEELLQQSYLLTKSSKK